MFGVYLQGRFQYMRFVKCMLSSILTPQLPRHACTGGGNGAYLETGAFPKQTPDKKCPNLECSKIAGDGSTMNNRVNDALPKIYKLYQ